MFLSLLHYPSTVPFGPGTVHWEALSGLLLHGRVSHVTQRRLGIIRKNGKNGRSCLFVRTVGGGWRPHYVGESENAKNDKQKKQKTTTDVQ